MVRLPTRNSRYFLAERITLRIVRLQFQLYWLIGDMKKKMVKKGKYIWSGKSWKRAYNALVVDVKEKGMIYDEKLAAVIRKISRQWLSSNNRHKLFLLKRNIINITNPGTSWVIILFQYFFDPFKALFQYRFIPLHIHPSIDIFYFIIFSM